MSVRSCSLERGAGLDYGKSSDGLRDSLSSTSQRAMEVKSFGIRLGHEAIV